MDSLDNIHDRGYLFRQRFRSLKRRNWREEQIDISQCLLFLLLMLSTKSRIKIPLRETIAPIKL